MKAIRSVGSAAVAAAIIVGWFLWPFYEAAADPAGSLLAAIRAVALLATVAGLTSLLRPLLSQSDNIATQCAIGFAIAFTIVGSIGFALRWTAGAQSAAESAHQILRATALDAFWCTVAFAAFLLLRRR